MKLFPIVLVALLLVACRGRDEPSATTTTNATRVDEACRAGQQSGTQCDAAQKALAEKEHRDAQSTFRSMGSQR